MITVDVCSDGRSVQCGVPLEDAFSAAPDDAPPAPDGNGNGAGGGKRRPKGRVAWVDVCAPTDEDWARLQETFHWHPLAVEDAKSQNQRSKMDVYDGFVYLSVRAWTGGKSDKDDLFDTTAEIDVFVGPDYLVTIRDRDTPALDETRRRWQRRADGVGEARERPAYLLYLLLDAVVDAFFPAMDQLDAEIDAVEMAVYDTKKPLDNSNLQAALRLKKRLLLMRQALTPLRDIVNEVLRTDNPRLFPPGLRAYWQDVFDHTLRLVEQVDLHRDLLGSAVDAVMAQTSHRLNQVMKNMTAISTILMSDALLAGIWGMNYKFMPELNLPYGYPLALGTMLVVALCLVWYFRRIRWL